MVRPVATTVGTSLRAVETAKPNRPYPHLLVAGSGEEEHARDYGDDYAQRGAEPVEEGLPLHEEEERRPPTPDDGPQDGRHDEDREQDEPDAQEVRQGLRQVPEEEHQREHGQLVERIQKNERQREHPYQEEYLSPRVQV